ncbi:small kinetochore-associated protein [Erythrolamprus reginae]|uniref:small kinetochore-associated protein n=1 Tax=Erythrolamprus reginae TaxID=121349 RepID=UPI00396CA02F
METEKTKIPIYISQNSKTTHILKELQPFDDLKQQKQNQGMDLVPLKDPVHTFDAKNPTACATLRDPNQRPMNRYRRETELRNRNKLLENVKSELSLKVEEMQKDMTDKMKVCDSLEKENEKLKKFRESCLLIFEAKNWDPVTGEQILEEEEMKKMTQTEITVLSDKLNDGLELFIQRAKEEKEYIQNAQTRWKQIEEERTHFLEEQQSFDREMEELLAALNQEDDFLSPS